MIHNTVGNREKTKVVIEVMGVTFKFKMDPINTIEGLHNLAIPDQIHEGKVQDGITEQIFGRDTSAGSPDSLRKPNVSWAKHSVCTTSLNKNAVAL